MFLLPLQPQPGVVPAAELASTGAFDVAENFYEILQSAHRDRGADAGASASSPSDGGHSLASLMATILNDAHQRLHPGLPASAPASVGEDAPEFPPAGMFGPVGEGLQEPDFIGTFEQIADVVFGDGQVSHSVLNPGGPDISSAQAPMATRQPVASSAHFFTPAEDAEGKPGAFESNRTSGQAQMSAQFGAEGGRAVDAGGARFPEGAKAAFGGGLQMPETGEPMVVASDADAPVRDAERAFADQTGDPAPVRRAPLDGSADQQGADQVFSQASGQMSVPIAVATPTPSANGSELSEENPVLTGNAAQMRARTALREDFSFQPDSFSRQSRTGAMAEHAPVQASEWTTGKPVLENAPLNAPEGNGAGTVGGSAVDARPGMDGSGSRNRVVDVNRAARSAVGQADAGEGRAVVVAGEEETPLVSDAGHEGRTARPALEGLMRELSPVPVNRNRVVEVNRAVRSAVGQADAAEVRSMPVAGDGDMTPVSDAGREGMRSAPDGLTPQIVSEPGNWNRVIGVNRAVRSAVGQADAAEGGSMPVAGDGDMPPVSHAENENVRPAALEGLIRETPPGLGNRNRVVEVNRAVRSAVGQTDAADGRFVADEGAMTPVLDVRGDGVRLAVGQADAADYEGARSALDGLLREHGNRNPAVGAHRAGRPAVEQADFAERGSMPLAGDGERVATPGAPDRAIGGAMSEISGADRNAHLAQDRPQAGDRHWVNPAPNPQIQRSAEADPKSAHVAVPGTGTQTNPPDVETRIWSDALAGQASVTPDRGTSPRAVRTVEHSERIPMTPGISSQSPFVTEQTEVTAGSPMMNQMPDPIAAPPVPDVATRIPEGMQAPAMPDMRLDAGAPARVADVSESFVLRDASPEQIERTYRIADQIIRSARAFTRDGATEITLRLDPPELGEVTIRLSNRDRMISGEISVENQKVHDIVQRHMGTLRETLSSQGVQVDRIDVSVDDRQAFDRETARQFAEDQSRSNDRRERPQQQAPQREPLDLPRRARADGHVDFMA